MLSWVYGTKPSEFKKESVFYWNRNKMWFAADNHNYTRTYHICAKGFLHKQLLIQRSNFNEIATNCTFSYIVKIA